VGAQAEVATTSPSRVILASGSPRRRELLARLGLRFEVRTSGVDETPGQGEAALDLVSRLAMAKAAAVEVDHDALKIAADTVVEIDGMALGKPADRADGRAMLARLSGRDHRVHTAVALVRGTASSIEVVTTVVTMQPYTSRDIDWYLDLGEWHDKAGAYAIQGAGGALVSRIEGSYSNVVGLPLAETIAAARRLGVDLLASAPGPGR